MRGNSEGRARKTERRKGHSVECVTKSTRKEHLSSSSESSVEMK